MRIHVNKEEEDAVLTDLDARVLQELLQDSQKLDLQEEQNMRNLLERGIKAKEKIDSPKQKKEDSPFQSEILQKLGSTKLWKAFERKAEDWVESAKLAISNKIERDAKLVASLGIFAFERIKQDVARALPATATKTWQPKNQFLLGNTTQAKEMTAAQKIRQEMSTPFDEIQAVGREIKDIFRTASTQADAAEEGLNEADVIVTKTPFSRNLKSTASSSKFKVNDKTKFENAYKRKQDTVLKREKENVVQSTTRLANEVVDSAYQIQREVQAEPNQPGYKSKTLRENTAKATNILVGGANKILGGAKNLAAAALEASKKEESMKILKLSESSNYVEPPPQGVENPPQMDTSTPSRVPWTSVSFGSIPPSLARLELEEILEAEMERLFAKLGDCIQSPQATWLDPNLIMSDPDFQDFPEEALEEVVVTLVQAQQVLVNGKKDPIFALNQVKEAIDEVCNVSARVGTMSIAQFLQQYLMYSSNNEKPVLLELDFYKSQLKEYMQQEQQAAPTQEKVQGADGSAWYVNEVQEVKPWYVEDDSRETITMDESNVVLDPNEYREIEIEQIELLEEEPMSVSRAVEAEEVEFLDVIPFTSTLSADNVIVGVSSQTGAAFSDVFVDNSDDPSIMAEIVTDDDYDVAMQGQGVKPADESFTQEEEDEEPSAAAMFALRSLDVILLAGEKTAAVRKFCLIPRLTWEEPNLTINSFSIS
jgi:hypothetical protein